MNLCKDTIEIDTDDLFYSNKEYVDSFLRMFEEIQFQEYFSFETADLIYKGNNDGNNYEFNKLAYFLKSENPVLRRSFFVALRNMFDYRTFFSIEERRDLFQFLKISDITFNSIQRIPNGDKNYPDFIVDKKIGVEVVHYKDAISGQFYKYLYPHKHEYMICDDLVEHMGSNAETLFNRIRPSIYEGKIFAWSEPLSNVYTVDYTYKMLIAKINTKLIKYNKSHYEVFEENVLLARVYFDLNEDNLTRLREKINADFPNIAKIYRLVIVAFSDYTIAKVSLLSGVTKIIKY